MAIKSVAFIATNGLGIAQDFIYLCERQVIEEHTSPQITYYN